MWAFVEDGKIKTIVSGEQGITIGDVQHSAQIFGAAWTDEERRAIGLFRIEYDDSRNGFFWVETEPEYKFEKDRVTATRRYKPKDFDRVKDDVISLVKAEAQRLIRAAMNDYEQRNSIAEMVIIIAGERTAETAKRFGELATQWDYVKAIRNYSNELEGKLRHVSTMSDLEAFDWRDGWPLPA